jgi:MinD-like ATPase involved in chromosome partitioning or flagellar assembly
LIKRNDFNSRVKQLAEKELHTMNSSDIIDFVLTSDPDNEVFLKQQISKFNFKFILNQFRKNMDLRLGDKIETVCNRHFYSGFEFLGNIGFDERVFDAIFHKKLFVREYPDTGAAVKLKKIAERLALPPSDHSGHNDWRW